MNKEIETKVEKECERRCPDCPIKNDDDTIQR
jgi:hypothetical protein